MSLPFSLEQFLSVFALYNHSVWPAQILLNILGILAIVLSARSNVPSKSIAGFLGGLWIWTGAVYHIVFFSTINPAASVFGGLFIIQGMLFLYSGVIKTEISFGFRSTVKGYTGALLLAYGLVIYPVLGYFLGHVYPNSPTFGAPCPSTIFTFGLLLWTTTRIRWYLLVIPCLWALVGSSAALTLGIYEDTGLLISAILGTAVLTMKRFRDRPIVTIEHAFPG
ncbi:MAG TPA: DUF6064 family protein [Bacteroidota bacterium]|nr:DUF6064 family protein [Bacteroidota bacterium]